MRKPRIADLFCGAGGAGMGLHRAGFEVVGYDIKPQPRYPFEFHQADALTVDLSGFDAVWASPPCQGYSIMSNNLPWHRHRTYPLLIKPTRDMLLERGAPFVIENVLGARHNSKVLASKKLFAHGMEAGYLCGLMFGLRLYRHRIFETNFLWLAPSHPRHTLTGHPRRERFVYGGSIKGLPGGAAGLNMTSLDRRMPDGTRQSISVGAAVLNEPNGGHSSGWRQAAEAMGIVWMKREELTQAIPPAYSEYLGRELMKHL